MKRLGRIVVPLLVLLVAAVLVWYGFDSKAACEQGGGTFKMETWFYSCERN